MTEIELRHCKANVRRFVNRAGGVKALRAAGAATLPSDKLKKMPKRVLKTGKGCRLRDCTGIIVSAPAGHVDALIIATCHGGNSCPVYKSLLLKHGSEDTPAFIRAVVGQGGFGAAHRHAHFNETDFSILPDTWVPDLSHKSLQASRVKQHKCPLRHRCPLYGVKACRGGEECRRLVVKRAEKLEPFRFVEPEVDEATRKARLGDAIDQEVSKQIALADFDDYRDARVTQQSAAEADRVAKAKQLKQLRKAKAKKQAGKVQSGGSSSSSMTLPRVPGLQPPNNKVSKRRIKLRRKAARTANLVNTVANAPGMSQEEFLRERFGNK